MSKKPQADGSRVVLVKWRFKPQKDGAQGTAKMWWSDGSKTEAETSYMEAVQALSAVQDNGGAKPS